MDTRATDELGIPAAVLMENAGVGATNVLLERFGSLAQHTLLLGGPGQNGGDAWVVARHLVLRGLRPEAVLLGDESRLSGAARTSFLAMRALGVCVHTLRAGDPALTGLLTAAGVLVDGLFGTGLDRPIAGAWMRVVTAMGDSGHPVLSLDLPSGIDCDTGCVLGGAVRAAVTVTFAGHKRGLHQHPGVDYAGEVSCVGIGAPIAGHAVRAHLFEPDDVARRLGRRPLDSHKGRAGHVLVVAGSPGRVGAALLAGGGALRGGAGLVTLASRESTCRVLDHRVTEMMTCALPDDPEEAVDAALEVAASMRAAVVGPGLGVGPWGRTVARGLARRLPIPAVLDADALTSIGKEGLGRLREAPAPRVLTPHPGEAARLLGICAAQVQADRYEAASRLVAASGAVVVLKGARTVIGIPDGILWVCRRGTPALAVAGTGDVLSGVVAAQMATSTAESAAGVAVVLHALAGEIAAESDRGLLAGEVARALPRALERCRA